MSWVARGSLVLVLVLVLIGCTPETSDDADDADDTDLERLPLRTLEGCVRLPGSVRVATVFNAFGEATPAADGCFSIPAHAERAQLTFALSEGGHPLRMGWLTPERPDLDARITAESLAWFAVGGPNAGVAAAPKLMELLAAAEPVDLLAQALDDAIVADADAFAQDHAATAAATADMVAALLAGPEGATSAPERLGLVLYDPSGEQSGLRLLTTSGVNAVSLQNVVRRAGHVFVDRISTFDEDGIETPSAKAIASQKVGAVTSLQGWTDAFSQIVTAHYSPGGVEGSEDVAYVPRTVGPIQLENEPGAKKTRYRVAVVGPGLRAGDLGDLPQAHRTQQITTSVGFLVEEALVPVLNQIVVPNLGVGQGSDNPFVPDLVADLVKVVTTQIPKAGQAMAQGDAVGAIAQLWDGFAGSGTLRNVVMEVVIEHFYDYRTEALTAGTQRAAAVAASFAKVTGAVDMLLTGADATFLATSVAQADRGDVWTVDVADAAVRFDPETSGVPPEARVRLQVRVPEAGDDVAFEYRFSTAGTAGSLETHTSQGTSVQSSQPWVDYVAGTEEGSDAITVEVYAIRGAQRDRLGDATATVEVTEVCEEQTPQRAALDLVVYRDFTCFTDSACSRAWPVWSFRAVEDVFSYELEIDTHGLGYGGFVTTTRRINLFADTGQPYRYYYNQQRAENYLSLLMEARGPLGANELIYVPMELSQLFTDNPTHLQIFDQNLASFEELHRGSEVTVTPLCP